MGGKRQMVGKQKEIWRTSADMLNRLGAELKKRGLVINDGIQRSADLGRKK